MVSLLTFAPLRSEIVIRGLILVLIYYIETFLRMQ